MHPLSSECARMLNEGAPVLLFTIWQQLPLTTDVLQIAASRGAASPSGIRPKACVHSWGASGTRPNTSCGAVRTICRWIVVHLCCRV
ncbi:DNA methylase (fragment) [Xanthomonas phaseoli pv. phaseoli]|uniref:DNA methylase n=1 Tax=Xanthomonas campestris pv. phaseoli TaxID=317013 RepID=A0A7Z7NIX9_XANCH